VTRAEVPATADEDLERSRRAERAVAWREVVALAVVVGIVALRHWWPW
jgi:hypothetical protein